MNKLFLYCTTLILVAFITACKTEIDLKIKKVEKNLVLNGVLTPDSLFTVFLQWTAPLGTPPSQSDTLYLGENELWESLVLVKDEQGNLIDTASACISSPFDCISSPYCDEGKQCASFLLLNHKVDFNKTYQIEVLRNDYPPLMATCNTPSDFAISFDLQDTFTNEFGGNKVYDLPITINDKANEDNFYIIEARGREVFAVDDEYYQAIGLYCLDPNSENTDIARQEDEYQRIFLSDAGFDGTNYAFNLKVSKSFAEFGLTEDAKGLFLDINVSSVSKDLYKYYKNFELHERSYGNDIFAQPVSMHSNIEGSDLGIFGAEITKTISFRVL